MARQKKDWAVADRIRDGLNELGIIVRDTPQGVIWEKKGVKHVFRKRGILLSPGLLAYMG